MIRHKMKVPKTQMSWNLKKGGRPKKDFPSRESLARHDLRPRESERDLRKKMGKERVTGVPKKGLQENAILLHPVTQLTSLICLFIESL